MVNRPSAVLDTNVVLSAFLSKSPTSPAKELIWQHWLNDEFTLLVSDALAEEMIEKLDAHQIEPEDIFDFLSLLERLAQWVEVPKEAVQPVVQEDPDDDLILACAVEGKADYLVTHDRHLKRLGAEYEGIQIVETLPFLWKVRGDIPPER